MRGGIGVGTHRLIGIVERRAVGRHALPAQEELGVFAWPSGRLAEVVGGLQCAREALQPGRRSAAQVCAQLVKRTDHVVATNGDAVEVQLQSRTAEKVRVCEAREPVDLHVEEWHQAHRIDERPDAPGRGGVFGERALDVRRARRGINA